MIDTSKIPKTINPIKEFTTEQCLIEFDDFRILIAKNFR